jgi:hypothetical protein
MVIVIKGFKKVSRMIYWIKTNADRITVGVLSFILRRRYFISCDIGGDDKQMTVKGYIKNGCVYIVSVV